MFKGAKDNLNCNIFDLVESKRYIFPFLKIKAKGDRRRVYLFGFIPLLKIKYEDNEKRIDLFDFIPLLKIRYSDNKKEVYLFKFIKIWKKVINNHKAKILFYCHGGYGDILIGFNFLLNLKEKFKDLVDIDIYINNDFANAKSFLYQQDFYNRLFITKENMIKNPIIKLKYDFVCSFCRYLDFKEIDLSKMLMFMNTNPVYEYVYKYIKTLKNICFNSSCSCEKILEQYSLLSGRDRVQQADLGNFLNVESKLKIQLKDEDKVLDKFNLKNVKYITVQNGCGIGIKSTNYTRLYTVEKYSKLVSLIKAKYKNYKVIQFGYENNIVINGVDAKLCGKTSFDEMLTILKHSTLHIDTECGSVHFRHFLCAKPSLVVFGVTNKNLYGYKENINVSNNKCPCDGCDWITKDWYAKCIRTNSSTNIPCMDVEPEYIFNELVKNGALDNE